MDKEINKEDNKIQYIFIGILIGELIGTGIAVLNLYQNGLIK